MIGRKVTAFVLFLTGSIVSLTAFASVPPMSCRNLSFAGVASACQDYTGTSYNPTTFDPEGDGTYACAVTGAGSGTPAIGAYCDPTGIIGTCRVAAGSANEINLHFYSGPVATLQGNCTGFMGGTWIGAGGGTDPSADTLPVEAKNGLISDAYVAVVPDSCSLDQLAAVVAANGAITFTPTGGASEGIVIYPGAAVDPRAYSVAAHMLAEEGFFVAIIPFPGNIAITDPMRGFRFVTAHPEITTWAVAGHSLGGVAASIWAQANPMGKLRGIAFWASYPATAMGPTPAVNLSTSALKVVSLYGDLDTVMNRANYEATKANLPATTRFAVIRGGNHAQFGFYGAQNGDTTAKISGAYQHELFVGATIQMMNRIGLAEDAVDSIYSEVSTDYAAVCQTAQKMIGHFRGTDLGMSKITSAIYDTYNDFVYSKPSFPTDGSGLVAVTAHAHQTANADDVAAPALMDGEVWCKMKTQESIVAAYGFAPIGAEKTCRQINQKLFTQAEDVVWAADPDLYDAYEASEVWLNFADDAMATMGPTWLANEVVLTETGMGIYEIQASALRTSMYVPAPYDGNYYCKLWTLESAVQFIVQAALSAY